MIKGSVIQSNSFSEAQNSNGILLTAADVLKLRSKKLIEIPVEKALFLNYGSIILSIPLIVSNTFAMRFFRKSFYLDKTNKGFLTVFTACNILPSYSAAFFNELYIKNNLLQISSYGLNECLLCREIKATIMTYGIGTLFSLGGIYMGTLLVANLTQTYDIPKITKKRVLNIDDRKKLVNIYKRIFSSTTKKFSPLFMKMSIISFLSANVLYYMQKREFYSLEKELSTFSKIDIENLNIQSGASFSKESAISKMIPFKKKDI